MATPRAPTLCGHRRYAIRLLACALLGGCAMLAPIELAERLYSGRFAAAVSQGEQHDSVSGRFTMAVRSDSITVDLASPLGITLARIRSTDNEATLTAPRPDGSMATWEGVSPEALTETVLGWRLPVSGLADWIAGRPAAGRPFRLTPVGGVAQRIDQDGWIVRIDERFEVSGEPRRLTLERAADDSGPAIRLKLIVDEATRTAAAQAMPPQ